MSDTLSTPASAPADDLFAVKGASRAAWAFAWSAKARSLSGLHGWLRGALFLYIAVQVLMFLIVAALLWALGSLAAGRELDSVGSTLLMVVGSLGQLSPIAVIGALVVCAFLYLRFVFRAAKNLHLSNARGLDISPGWAVGWSFIPVANLVMTYTVMREIWRVSADPERSRRDPPQLLGWWWGLYLGGNIIGRISDFMAPQESDASDIVAFYEAFVPSAATALFSNVLSIASAFFLMAVVRQITDAQEALRATAAFEE